VSTVTYLQASDESGVEGHPDCVIPVTKAAAYISIGQATLSVVKMATRYVEGLSPFLNSIV